MSDKFASAPLFRFGAFEVDITSRELRKHGVRISLEGKPFEILLTLLENPGQVITRKTLRQKLWPDSYVRYEQSLNTAVNKLRSSLGDSSASPRYVETLPRLGYRFIAPVEKLHKSREARNKTMLAVLPLDNLSGDPEQSYFVDGLFEELLSELGQLNPKRLGVIARTSSMIYKNTSKSVDQIASELHVDYIMEGSVRLDKKKKRVRVTVQLIHASDQTHAWTASYDHELHEILTVQRRVAEQIGEALALELLPSSSSRPAATNIEANEAYLQGRHFCGQRSEETLKRALASFERALILDPNYAKACAGIADCCTLLVWFGAMWPREAGSRAFTAAARALEIDPGLGEAHASMGLVRFWHTWDWDGAEEMFQRSIDLNPSYAMARQWYASFLNAMGRHAEAREQLLSAREIDPHALIIQMNMADSPFFERDYARAVQYLEGLLRNVPQFFPALFNLGRAYVQMEKYPEAIAAFEKAIALSGNREGKPALAHAYALAGKTAEARQILDEFKNDHSGRYIASPMIARIHLGLGESEQAILWLEKGYEERSNWMSFLMVDPVWDPLRKDVRFRTLLEKKVGLAPNSGRKASAAS
jgi:TolB-like protein/Tfp pilus assembly protein PilF